MKIWIMKIKSLFSFALILLMPSFSFSQNVSFFIHDTNYDAISTEWTVWKPIPSTQIEFRVKRGEYNKGYGKYRWWINYRHTYKEDICFLFAIGDRLEISRAESSGNFEKLEVTKAIVGPGYEIHESWFLVDSDHSVSIYLKSLKLNPDIFCSDISLE